MISRVAEAKFDKDNTDTLLRLTKWFGGSGTDGKFGAVAVPPVCERCERGESVVVAEGVDEQLRE